MANYDFINTTSSGTPLSTGGKASTQHWLSDIRRQVYEYECKEFAPLDFYREFSEEVRQLFSTVKYFDQEENKRQVAPLFYGSPERAIAKIFEERNMTLPVISFTVKELDDDEDRRKPDFNLVIETLRDEVSRKNIRVVSMAPMAVTLRFTLNVWARYTENINQIVEQIVARFNPYLQLTTKFGDSFHAHLVDVQDISSDTATDQEDRLLRKTISFDVDAYIPTRKYQVTNTGEIHTVYLELSGLDGTVNTTVTAPGGTTPPTG